MPILHLPTVDHLPQLELFGELPAQGTQIVDSVSARSKDCLFWRNLAVSLNT
jgi:hypothetical protein